MSDVKYDAELCERLIEVLRRDGAPGKRSCPDCACYSCADCHCSLDHAQRDRCRDAADQLAALTAAVENLRGMAKATQALQLAESRSIVEWERGYEALREELGSANDAVLTAGSRITELESRLATAHDMIRHLEQERDAWPAAYRQRAAKTDARIKELEAGLTDLYKITKLDIGPLSPASVEDIERARRLLNLEDQCTDATKTK